MTASLPLEIRPASRAQQEQANKHANEWKDGQAQ